MTCEQAYLSSRRRPKAEPNIVGYIIIYKDDGAYYNNLSYGGGRRYDYPKLYKSKGTAMSAVKNSTYIKEDDVDIKPVVIYNE